jgi:hypothetical protein
MADYATLHLRLYVTWFNKGRYSRFSNFRITIYIIHLCDNRRIGCTWTHSGRPIAEIGRQTRAYSLLRDSDSGPAPCYAVLRTVNLDLLILVRMRFLCSPALFWKMLLIPHLMFSWAWTLRCLKSNLWFNVNPASFRPQSAPLHNGIEKVTALSYECLSPPAFIVQPHLGFNPDEPRTYWLS